MNISTLQQYASILKREIRQLTEPEKTTNNFDLLIWVTLLRTSMFISFIWIWRRYIDDGSYTMWLAIGMMVYGLLIIVPWLLTVRNRLAVLDHRIFVRPSIIEIILICVLSWRINDPNIMFLEYIILMPMGIIMRLRHRTSLREQLFWSLSILLFLTILSRGIPDPYTFDNWWTHLPANFIMVTLLTTLAWRHNEQKRGVLLQSNLQFAFETIQKMSGATLCFCRMATEGNLFLLGTSPWGVFKDMLDREIIELSQAESLFYSITAAFKDQQEKWLESSQELLDAMIHKHIVHQYRLQSGVMRPLPNHLGTFSLYWDQPVRNHPKQEQLPDSLHYLANYLIYEEKQIEQWRLRFSNRWLIHTKSWSETSELTRVMLAIKDLWESADILLKGNGAVPGVVEMSNALSGAILFYEEQEDEFACKHGHGTSSPSELDNLTFSLSEVKDLWEDTDEVSQYLNPEQSSVLEPTKKYLAFPLRAKDDSEGKEEWRWIGIMILVFKENKQPTVFDRYQLDLVALNASSDLRTCQLHLKSETAIEARDALKELIDQLSKVDEGERTDKTLFKTITGIINEALRNSHSISFGIVNSNDYQVVEERWYTTLGDPHSVGLDSLERLAEHKEMIDNCSKVRFFRCDGQSQYHKVAREHHHIACSYGIGFHLEDNDYIVIYVNYAEDELELAYRTRQILGMLPDPIVDAWHIWHRWNELVEVEKQNQRELFRYEVHDQLNELHFNVVLPLERLVMRLKQQERFLLQEQAETVLSGAQGVDNTLRQINETIRDKIYHQQGLFAALKNFENKYDGLKVVTRGDEPHTKQCTPLYLIASEAVVNAYKHGSTSVELDLDCSNNEQITLQVKDNGEGYDGTPRRGSGTGLMQYQARLLKATIEWHIRDYPHDGQGTWLIVNRTASHKHVNK